MNHRNFIAIAFSAVFAGGLFVGTASAEDPKPCKSEKFEIKQVEEACKKGGEPAAKALMKKAVKKAKDAGEDVNCKTCHESTKELEKNKPGSVEKLRKLLE